MTGNTRRKLALWAAGLMGTTFLLPNLPSGCGPFIASGAASAFDFCAVLNCTGSTYFDLCTDRVLLTDCPNQTAANP